MWPSQEGKHHGDESLCREGFSRFSFHWIPFPGGQWAVMPRWHLRCIYVLYYPKGYVNPSGPWKF